MLTWKCRRFGAGSLVQGNTGMNRWDCGRFNTREATATHWLAWPGLESRPKSIGPDTQVSAAQCVRTRSRTPGPPASVASTTGQAG